MWTCPTCGRSFANRNQTHTCRQLSSVEDHLLGRPPGTVATYRTLEAAVLACGPAQVLAERTRIAFHARMSFASAVVRTRWVDVGLVLARRVDSPRFRKVETFSPRNHLHVLRLTTWEDVDDELRGWLAEAYEIGVQHHLDRR
jgi:hypothetical protein